MATMTHRRSGSETPAAASTNPFDEDKEETPSSPPNPRPRRESKVKPEDIFLPDEERSKRKRRAVLIQLLVLSGVSLMQGIAFSLRHLETSLNKNNSLGTISLSCVFLGVFVSCLMAPTVIHVLGARMAILLGCIGISVFTIANFIPEWTYILPIASVFTGLTFGIFLVAQGTYVTAFSLAYSDYANKDPNEVFPRFMGFFYMLFISAPLWGNLISSVILQATKSNMHSDASGVCGALYCPHLQQINTTYTQEKGVHGIHALLGVYLLFSLLGLVLAWFFIPNIQEYSELRDRLHESCTKSLDTCRLWGRVRMLALVPLCIYSGVEQQVIYGTFSEAYVTCKLGLQWVGFVTMSLAGSATLCSLALGLFSKHVPRPAIFMFGAGLTVGLMVTLLTWRPGPDVAPYFVVATIWGFTDAIYRAEVSTLLGMLFLDEAESAYANFRLWQSLGLAAAFAYGKVLCVTYRVLVAMAVLCVGTVLYCVIEIRLKMSEQEGKAHTGGRAVLMPEVATWLPSLKPYDADRDQWELVEPVLPHDKDAHE